MGHRFNWMKKLSPVLRTKDYCNPDEACRVMIEFSGNRTEKTVFNIISTWNGKINRKMSMLPFLAAEIPLPAMKELAQVKKVKKIWLDTPVQAQLSTSILKVNDLIMRDSEYSGKNITIAVLDTGIYPHTDLIFPENRIVAWHDFVNQKPRPYDDNGHGTHIAGIIGGNGFSSRNKFRGMAPGAKLAGVKVLDKYGRGKMSDVISGIEWCIRNRRAQNIKIINLSVSLAAPDLCSLDPLSRITAIAIKKGIVICAAACYDSIPAEAVSTPNSGIITIGNRDDARTRSILNSDMSDIRPAYDKNRAFQKYLKPDLLIPGTKIISLKAGGGYLPLTGTSVATALVSGIVAQLLEEQPHLKPSQIKKILKKNTPRFNYEPISRSVETLQTDAIFCKHHPGYGNKKHTLSKKERTFFVLRGGFCACAVNPYFLFLIFILLLLSFSPNQHARF